jgi:hypothetical protein
MIKANAYAVLGGGNECVKIAVTWDVSIGDITATGIILLNSLSGRNVKATFQN